MVSEYPDQKKETILIVDDVKENLRLLNTILRTEGYIVLSAINGILALESARHKPPDLILLDIKMPGIDGFETCHRLKAHEQTSNVPVIFLSALDETTDKVKGFKSGAVDYITKPVDADEVLARVKTHLTLRSIQKKLESTNQTLAKIVRQREGVEHVIYHDIRSPLQLVINSPHLIKRWGTLNEKQNKYLNRITQAGSRIMNIVESSMTLLSMEKGEYKADAGIVDIVNTIREILDLESETIKEKAIVVHFLINGEKLDSDVMCKVLGEESLCHSIFSNLIKNAIEASVHESQIKLDVLCDDMVRICIHNEQPVPKAIRQNFFEKYITAEKYKGTGLGTYTAKLATEALGGSIHLESSDSSGTSVIVVLPRGRLAHRSMINDQ